MCFQQNPELIIVILLAVIGLQQSVSGSGFFPPQWTQMCSNTLPRSERVRPPIFVNLRCLIRRSQYFRWKLNDLRAWIMSKGINRMTTPINRTVVYNISVTCEPGANISLPWPARVPGLRELYVTSCHILDKYINYNDGIDSTIADDMRILDIRHSTYVFKKNDGEFDDMTNAYYCGQSSSIETFITSNISITNTSEQELESSHQPQPQDSSLEDKAKPVDVVMNVSNSGGPAKPEDRLIKDTTKVISDNTNLPTEELHNETSSQVEKENEVGKSKPLGHDEKSTRSPAEDGDIAARQVELRIIQVRRNFARYNVHCNFVKMKEIDESMAQFTHLNHFEIMARTSTFPLLKRMNYSYIGFKKLPRELTQWRVYFPNLTHLDFSHNYVTEVNLGNDPPTRGVGIVTFDLRSNNITTINLDVIKSWANIDDFFVDIRNNPINCGCDLASTLSKIVDESTFVGRLALYQYVKYLRCQEPVALRGRELHTLTTDSLECPTNQSNDGVIITFFIVFAVVILLTIIFVKFQVEIRILFYTRFHVRFPCDTDVQENKTFDAFVSYSNEDYVWVFENLIKILENPTNKNSIKDKRTSNHSNNAGRVFGQRCFRLCVHQRDFVPGKTIFDNIMDCIQASRHTIIVLSPSFMKSQWAMEELRQAYRQSLVEKTRHLIIILLQKIPNDEMDPLLRRCCKTFTYLDASDSLFKDRLIFSLTTTSRFVKTRASSVNVREKKVATQSDDVHVYDTIGNTYAHLHDKLKVSETHKNDKTASTHVNDRSRTTTHANIYEKTSATHANAYDKTNSIHANVYDESEIIYAYDNVAHFSNRPQPPARDLFKKAVSSINTLTVY